jgi:sugar (pentulose or hexulose) kinase
MTFIGIDIGTTRTKALLYDADAERILVAESTPVVPTKQGDFRDADAVVAVVMGCVDRLVSGLPEAERARIAGIGITSLSEEMVLLDSAGRSLAPMPAWYTTVGADAAREQGHDPSFSWSKLRWAFDELAERDDVRGVTTLNGYVAAVLSAGSDFPVDHSHASRTGFFDVRTGEWHTARFEATGFDASLLPPLVAAGTAVSTVHGDLAQRWGIPVTSSIVLAGHDHFCGAFAVGVRGEGQLYVSAGTSEAHCLIVEELPEGPLPPTVGFGRFVDGRHFYLHRQLPSGHLYRQWTELLGLADDESRAQEAERLFAEPLGSLGTTMLPGFDTDTRSTLLDLAPGATRYTIVRALLEGLACAALRVDRELVELADRPITGAVAAGIPCASPFWQELRGQLAAAPLAVSREDEAPALGAALLCQKAVLGLEPAPSRLHAVSVDETRTAEYAALFTRFEHKLAAHTALTSARSSTAETKE